MIAKRIFIDCQVRTWLYDIVNTDEIFLIYIKVHECDSKKTIGSFTDVKRKREGYCI